MISNSELLIKLRTIAELGGFDALEAKAKQGSTAMKGMENTTNAAAKKMKTDLDQVNNTNFSSLNNKFTSTIRSMVSTSASGAKAIGQNLSNMTDGIDGAITSVAAGMGVMELFEKSMGKSLTSTQLHNAKPGDYQSIMDQYMKFTTASSASDDDINKMLRYTYSGNSSSTYKAINAVDAISYNADKLQRQEGIRGWGTYLSGGWSAASGMMRDEPLTADQVKLLQNAKTYDQRIAAMETIAKQKGNMDSSGNSLSTTTDGTLGKYNKTLAFADSIMRGATSTFETFMTTIDPIITGFNNLDPGIKDVIGGTLTWGILLTAGAAGLGILSKVLSPVGSVLSTGVSKLKDALSGAKDVKDKVSGLKDALDSKKLVSTVNIKAATVNVNGKTTSTSSTPTPTTTGNGKSGQNVPPVVTPWWQPVAGVAAMAGANFSAGSTLGMIKDRMSWYLPGNWGKSGTAAITQSQMAQPATNTFGLGTLSGEGLGRTAWNMLFGGQDPSTAAGNAAKTMIDQSQMPRQQTATEAWLSGAAGNTGAWFGSTGSGIQSWANGVPDWLESLKDWKMPDLGIDDWFKNANLSQDVTNWANTNIGKPVTDTWNNAKTTVMNNPVLGSAITEVSNLFNDPHKAWTDARNWVLSNPTVGKAWADAYALYSNVKSWWDAARRYVQSRPIDQSTGLNNGGGGVLAGDEGADEGYGTGHYYEPAITTSSNSTTKKETNYNVTVKVDTVDSDSRVDQIGQAVAIVLNKHNNGNGN